MMLIQETGAAQSLSREPFVICHQQINASVSLTDIQELYKE